LGVAEHGGPVTIEHRGRLAMNITRHLPITHKLEIGLGMKDGEENVDKYLASGFKIVNGWKIGSMFGDRLFYSGDGLKRAAAAKGGIYGNDTIEAV
jgi:hypothetical protein